jgi:hypothetical protein
VKLVAQPVGFAIRPMINPPVTAGGPSDPQDASKPGPLGLSPELLRGISFENGEIRVPASKVREIVGQYIGRDAELTLQHGSLRFHKDGSAKVWTTLTPSLSDDGGVRIAFSDTKWHWFIFSGRLENDEARDKFLEEIQKKVRPREVDDDDVREYREKQAEIGKWRDRLAQLEALPSAGERENAKKIASLRERIEKQERKLAGRDFAHVRNHLEPKEPSLGEKVGRSMRPDGDDAVHFDLPLPQGVQVESFQVDPEGLRIKIKGPAINPAVLPSTTFAPPYAPLPVAPVPDRPVVPPAPVPPDLPTYCGTLGDFAALQQRVLGPRPQSPAVGLTVLQSPAVPAGDDGVARLLAQIPTGSGTAMGFVPVTIAREGAGIRFNAPVLGEVRILPAGGRWQVHKGGEVAAFVKRASESRDPQGNPTYTLELESGARQVPAEPIVITVADGGRTLKYGTYSVTMNQAA